MAIWTGNPTATSILRAAEYWKSACLLDSTSVFSASAIWTVPNLEEIVRRYIGNPLFGPEPFWLKLRRQFAGSSSEIHQLLAELVWVLVLFPTRFRASKKRERILDLWNQAKVAELKEEFLSDEVLEGIGYPGTGYMAKMPDDDVPYSLCPRVQAGRIEYTGTAPVRKRSVGVLQVCVWYRRS